MSLRLRYAPLLAVMLLCAACGERPSRPEPGPPTVGVTTPFAARVVEWDGYTGRFEAIDSVTVRARVSGYLESIHFEDGDLVEAGDPLFTLDRRPFEAALEAAEARLAEATADRDLADVLVERTRQAFERNAASELEVTETKARAEAADARVRAARAAVRDASLDLEFTTVAAPIAGRVSQEFITEGNLITGGGGAATPLTTIESVDPIHLQFDASELDYLRYTELATEGRRRSSREARNPALVGLAGEEGYPRTGEVDFVDNAFDRGTATILVRVVVGNEDGVLAPGMFGRLLVLGRSPTEALLVPEQAIGQTQTRRYVLTVGEGGKVERKTIRLGNRIGGNRVVLGGLEADARVIVDGLTNLRAGMTVETVEADVSLDRDALREAMYWDRLPRWALDGTADGTADGGGSGRE